MRRPHRSIETFDISLMAVVTKAMGAFLVLMLLLMPYYSSSPLGKDEAQSLAKKVQDADLKIKGVLDKLGDEGARRDLSLAREQLGSGQQLIDQLTRAIDQMGAQVSRLEGKIATLATDLEQIKKENETLLPLRTENEALKAELTKLHGRVAGLEKQLEELQGQIAQMQLSTPEQVATLKQRIAELEQQNAMLRARVAEIEQRNAALQSQVARLQQQVAALQAETSAHKATIAQLQESNSKLVEVAMRGSIAGVARSSDCPDTPFQLGALSAATTVGNEKSKYIFDTTSSLGSGWSFPYKNIFEGNLLYTEAYHGRYFLFLLFRKSNTSPLRRPPRDCTADVTVMSRLNSVEGKQKAAEANTIYVVRSTPAHYVYHFADLIFAPEGSIKIEAPSPEGTAYLNDQVAHATKEEMPAVTDAPRSTP